MGLSPIDFGARDTAMGENFHFPLCNKSINGSYSYLPDFTCMLESGIFSSLVGESLREGRLLKHSATYRDSYTSTVDGTC